MEAGAASGELHECLLLGVQEAGESHFEGLALRKRVLLQFAQRFRVEPRVLSSSAIPHLEQTYVPWPGFVPARATAHLPARWRQRLRKGEDSDLDLRFRSPIPVASTPGANTLGLDAARTGPRHRSERWPESPPRGLDPDGRPRRRVRQRDDGSGEPRHPSSLAARSSPGHLNRSSRGRAHDLLEPPRPHVVDEP